LDVLSLAKQKHNNMKRPVITFLICVAVVYFVPSFYYLDVNPRNWSSDARLMFCILGLPVALLFSAMVMMTDELNGKR
jgi:hypothetical protein